MKQAEMAAAVQVMRSLLLADHTKMYVEVIFNLDNKEVRVIASRNMDGGELTFAPATREAQTCFGV